MNELKYTPPKSDIDNYSSYKYDTMHSSSSRLENSTISPWQQRLSTMRDASEIYRDLSLGIVRATNKKQPKYNQNKFLDADAESRLKEKEMFFFSLFKCFYYIFSFIFNFSL